MWSIAVVVLAVLLAGCSIFPTREQFLDQDRAECTSYGANPGTDAFMQCMMAKDQQRMALAGAFIASGGLRPPPPAQPYYLPQPNLTPPPR